jgi:hypothetical protein
MNRTKQMSIRQDEKCKAEALNANEFEKVTHTLNNDLTVL